MNHKVAVGSIVTSNRGVSREVLKVDGVRIVIADDDGNFKVINRDRVVKILHPNPRNAVIITNGRVEVDLDRLSLDYSRFSNVVRTAIANQAFAVSFSRLTAHDSRFSNVES